MNPPDQEERTARVWPARKTQLEGDELATSCQACGLEWIVDKALAGFRMRCECGSWVGAPELPRGAELPDHPRARRLEYWFDDDAPSEPAFRVRDSSSPMSASHDSQARPSKSHSARRAEPVAEPRGERRLFELFLLLVAFYLPAFGLTRLINVSELPWLAVFSSLGTGLLVLLISGRKKLDAPAKLGRANWRHLAEANLAAYAGAAGVLALAPQLSAAPMLGGGLDTVLGQSGLLGGLIGVALLPALVEEYAFRGVLQGRLGQLFGTGSALLMGSAAFALAHGSSLYLPVYLLLGLYLAWLRKRSQSLAAPMLMHLLFNGLLVMAHYFAWELPVVG